MTRHRMPGVSTIEDLRLRCEVLPSGCWEFTGKRGPHGQIRIIVRAVSGHQSLHVALAKILTGQPLPDGMRYLPTCGKIDCCNPQHRRLGSTKEFNALRAALNRDSRLASKPATGPKLYDKLDALGRPGQMPQDIARALRKPGSNARPIEAMVLNRPDLMSEPRITDKTRVTVAPVCHDQRFTVRELPPGYVSALDPREARPWAQAAVGGRA